MNWSAVRFRVKSRPWFRIRVSTSFPSLREIWNRLSRPGLEGNWIMTRTPCQGAATGVAGEARAGAGGHKEVDMPRGDRTGPDGMGPMTGRTAGFCAGYGAPGFMSPAGGRGLGYGRGYGRGLGRGFTAGFAGYGRGLAWAYGRGWNRSYGYASPVPITPEAGRTSLEWEAAYMEEELKAIRKRLDGLETNPAD